MKNFDPTLDYIIDILGELPEEDFDLLCEEIVHDESCYSDEFELPDSDPYQEFSFTDEE